MSWNFTKKSGNAANSASYSDQSEVMRIYKMLDPRPEELVASGRRFIKEGDVQVWSVKERMKKQRHLFLFNDVLLITKKEGKKKFWLKVYISLRSGLKIQDVQDSTNDRPDVEFRIYAPKKTFILFGFNPAHKNEWIVSIQEQIDALEGKAEAVKKERIKSLYQEPPAQVGGGPGGFDFDSDFDPRGSAALPPPEPLSNLINIEPAQPFGGPQFNQPPPQPAFEEATPVPVLPPPPGGVKRDAGIGAFDAQPINPYLPPGAQPVNPYAPPPGVAHPSFMAPGPVPGAHASVYAPAPGFPQPVAVAPGPVPGAHASVYAPSVVLTPQPSGFGKPLPTPAPGAPGAIPPLPPKPAQYTPQPTQADPFDFIGQPSAVAAQPTANPNPNPFGNDDFDELARRASVQPQGPLF